MTTLTPEKEAPLVAEGTGPNELKLRLEWAVGVLRAIVSPEMEDLTFAPLIAHAGLDLAAIDEGAMADADNTDALQSLAEARATDAAEHLILSTERQAREAAEKEVERLDKAFKRSSMDWLQMVQDLQAKADVLVEALKPFAAMAGKPLKITAIDGGSLSVSVDTNDFHRAAATLSALPPPVPAEEACAHKWFGKTSTIGPRWQCSECREITDKDPTQAPQDVAGLVEEITHVIYAHMIPPAHEPGRKECKLAAEAIISLFRPSPISHETKALVLAAADNNREALVEACRPFAELTVSGSPVDPAKYPEFAARVQALKDALTAFQSRQEGKQP